MKKILGISAFYHDSSASLVIDGEIIAAVQEERFTRKKHTPDFPVNSIKYCLEESGLSINELDAIIFYDKPLLKFERLLETYYAFAPKGLISFLKAIPVWLREKLFLKKLIYDQLKEVGNYDKKKVKLLFSEHHLSHAASAFLPSPFEESAILTIDGVGEWSTASIGYGNGGKIKLLKELNFPHSVGLLYSAFTYYLGFTVNSGEYKLMGLAPYGNPNAEETKNFRETILDKLIDLKEDGSIWLNQKYFRYATGLRMTNNSKWKQLFGISRREPESKLEQVHCNLALAIQQVTEEIVLAMAKEAQKLTGSKNLCLAGGVALNCVANGKLIKKNWFDEIYIQPAAGDAGGSLGAALAASTMYFKEERQFSSEKDQMKGAYLGPDFSEKEILQMCKRMKASYKKYDDFDLLARDIATCINDGDIVGWFQDRMEFGPRALGNRSIIGNPTLPDMQKKLNLKIKYREGFRPFAPSVLDEELKNNFDLQGESPYMLLVASVKKELCVDLPANAFEMPLMDRLYLNRSSIQSVTHMDYSARIQTVHKETNPKYWQLIKSFKDVSGVGLVVNTSFNVRGEPIVCDPWDAYRCFMNTEMDVLVIDNFVFKKQEQPDWDDKEKWNLTFEMD